MKIKIQIGTNQIRGYCIKYASAKAKDRRKTEESIMSELENLKIKLDNEYNEDDNVRYLNLLHEQESLGAIIRSNRKHAHLSELKKHVACCLNFAFNAFKMPLTRTSQGGPTAHFPHRCQNNGK